MYQKLLATLDGSQASESVLPYLTGLVHILNPEEVVLLSIIEARGDRETHPTESHLREVAPRSDLIVMSTHGRTSFNRWLLGSVEEQVRWGAG